MKMQVNEQEEMTFSPDSVEEWLQLIYDIGYDYDGCNNVESLKELIDELIKYSQNAKDCLYTNKLFPDNSCYKLI